MDNVTFLCSGAAVRCTSSASMLAASVDVNEMQALVAMGSFLNVVSQHSFGAWMEANCADIVAEWRAEGVASCAQAPDAVDDDGECHACRGTGEGPGESACGHCRGKGFVVEAEHA